MTREEFIKQSNAIFFKAKDTFAQEALKKVNASFDEYSQKSDNASFQSFMMELLVLMSTLSFEMSCAYSEKLALLLFDQEVK